MALKSVDRSLSVFVGNLSPEVPLKDVEEIVYELFVQAGPLNGIKVEPRDTQGLYPKGYAFVQFLHEESVDYASSLMDGVTLYGRRLRVAPAKQDRPSQGLQSPSCASAQNPNSPVTHPEAVRPVNSPRWSSRASVEAPFPHSSMVGMHHNDGQHQSPLLSRAGMVQENGQQHPSPHSPAGGYLPLDSQRHPSSPYPSNQHLHQWRLGARDHPQWVSDETRRNLGQYHQSYLQQSQPDSRDRHVSVDHSHSSDRTRAHGGYSRTTSTDSSSRAPAHNRSFSQQQQQQQSGSHNSPRDYPQSRRHSHDEVRGGPPRKRYSLL